MRSQIVVEGLPDGVGDAVMADVGGGVQAMRFSAKCGGSDVESLGSRAEDELQPRAERDALRCSGVRLECLQVQRHAAEARVGRPLTPVSVAGVQLHA